MHEIIAFNPPKLFGANDQTLQLPVGESIYGKFKTALITQGSQHKLFSKLYSITHEAQGLEEYFESVSATISVGENIMRLCGDAKLQFRTDEEVSDITMVVNAKRLRGGVEGRIIFQRVIFVGAEPLTQQLTFEVLDANNEYIKMPSPLISSETGDLPAGNDIEFWYLSYLWLANIALNQSYMWAEDGPWAKNIDFTS